MSATSSAGRPLDAAVRSCGDCGEQSLADALIVATGAEAKLLGLPTETARSWAAASRPARPATASSSRARTWSWSAAATRRWRRRRYLTKSPAEVTVVHRRDELRASKIMQERALRNPKIEFVWNRRCDDVLGDAKNRGVTGVAVDDWRPSGERSELPIERRVHRDRPQAQHRSSSPASSRLDERGYIMTKPRIDRTRTSPASSRAATCRTRSIARRSRPPAPAAWRRSTPSAGSKPSTADRSAPRHGSRGVYPARRRNSRARRLDVVSSRKRRPRTIIAK